MISVTKVCGVVFLRVAPLCLTAVVCTALLCVLVVLVWCSVLGVGVGVRFRFGFGYSRVGSD